MSIVVTRPCPRCAGTGRIEADYGHDMPSKADCPDCSGTGRVAQTSGVNVVDLAAARADREKPDAEYVRHDDFGRPMYLYLLEYQYEGGRWGGVDVWAYSMKDAQARVEAMHESLVLLGQCYSSIPA